MKDKKNLYSIESYICLFTYHIVARLHKSENKKKGRKPRLHLNLSTLDLHLLIFFYNLQTETLGEVLVRFKMLVRPRANLFIWNPLD
jgi:hypothetical protein